MPAYLPEMRLCHYYSRVFHAGCDASVRCQGDGYFLFPIEGRLSLFYTLHPSSEVSSSAARVTWFAVTLGTKVESGLSVGARHDERARIHSRNLSCVARFDLCRLSWSRSLSQSIITEPWRKKQVERWGMTQESPRQADSGPVIFPKKWQNHTGNSFSAHDVRDCRFLSCFSRVTTCYNIMQQTAKSRVTKLNGVSH